MPDTALPTVVAVGGDPGGAAALAPVLTLLHREGKVRVTAYPHHEAIALWEAQGISVVRLPDRTTAGAARETLIRESACVLVTSTSSGTRAGEKIFIAAARRLGIPSLSVLDFWSNYRSRWADTGGQPTCLPDLIAVMDAQARDEMVAEGFDPAMLVITGQPAYDDLREWQQGFTPAHRQDIRRSLGVGPEDLLVIFASQPISAIYRTGESDPSYPGYTECTVIRLLVDALDRIEQEVGRHILLAIRPHPREDPRTFSAVGGRAISAGIVSAPHPRDLVMAADLVLGMTTALLVEACYLGCIVGSLQPGLRGPDVLPTNRIGCSRGIYAAGDIKPAVEQLLLDPVVRREMRQRAVSLAPASGATRLVADLIHRILRQDSREPK
jgi:hypothetical protein